MEPLLFAERKRCEKTSAKLARVAEELDRFRTESEPAYTRWFYGKFGDKVTRLRDLKNKAAELVEIIDNVENEALFADCSMREAYARLERMRRAAEKIDELRFRSRSEKSSSEQTSQNNEDDLPPEIEEYLKMRFDSLYEDVRFKRGQYAREFESFKQSFREDVFGKKQTSEDDAEDVKDEQDNYNSRRQEEAQVESAPQTEEEPRLKALFRELARKLHPDANPAITPRERELWHEVHAAYESKNLDALETLSAMLESESSAGYLRIRSVSRLRAVFDEFQRKLKAAQKAVRTAKKEPAWGFGEIEKNPARLNELAQDIEREVKEDTCALEAMVADYEEQIESWKNPVSNKMRRRPVPNQGSSRRRARMTKAEMDEYTGFGE